MYGKKLHALNMSKFTVVIIFNILTASNHPRADTQLWQCALTTKAWSHEMTTGLNQL